MGESVSVREEVNGAENTSIAGADDTCLDESKAFDWIEKTVRRLPLLPGKPLEGRGIVICAGGLKYLTCAWVGVNMLRKVGCELPIQIWHLGPREMPEEFKILLKALNVETIDAEIVRRSVPARRLNGWEVKPYAIINSPFNEVIALDADNIPLVNPEFLFDTPDYRRTGAIFWPDYGRLESNRQIWSLTGVTYRDEPEFESGQIVVDKTRCWAALQLTMAMNEQSDFWYRHIHGDKETFHVAWRKLDQPYAMPHRGVHSLPGTMCQHDFNGRRIFQHRNMRKWTLGNNQPVPGFLFEKECLAFIRQLEPYSRALSGHAKPDPDLAVGVGGRVADYERIGFDSRMIMFESDGTIGMGVDRMERFWGMRREGAVLILELYGDDGVTARLVKEVETDSTWVGHWLIHERMRVKLRFISSAQ